MGEITPPGSTGDQREAAHEYAAAIAAEPRRNAARRNRASRISDRFARRLRAGLGPTGEMLADDFVWSTAHPDGEVTEAGGDAFLTDAGGRYRPGADLQLWPIAIRDDRVMLSNEFDGAAADPTRLTLLAIDDHDRLARVSQFDPDALDTAMTELERTWWATLSTDERSTVRVSGHLGQAFRTQDRAALRRVLAPDFVVVGHGEFGLGEVDREQYLTSHQGRTDLFGASRQAYDVIELPSPAVMVVRSAVDTAPERTDWEVVIWNVIHVRDDRVVRLETHPEMDPGAAGVGPPPRAGDHRSPGLLTEWRGMFTSSRTGSRLRARRQRSAPARHRSFGAAEAHPGVEKPAPRS